MFEFEFEFYTGRSFLTADAADIKRFRVVLGDGGHGEPVICAILKDGRVGRFFDVDGLLSAI